MVFEESPWGIVLTLLNWMRKKECLEFVLIFLASRTLITKLFLFMWPHFFNFFYFDYFMRATFILMAFFSVGL